MPRPKKCRRVDFFPEHTYFKPIGKSDDELDEIILNLEELEAMRLKDIEKLNQEKCAEKMDVSRQTFQNIIDSARQKVTKALTNGLAINITGGIYCTKKCKVVCKDCNYEYDFDFSKTAECPRCKSNEFYCMKKQKLCNKV